VSDTETVTSKESCDEKEVVTGIRTGIVTRGLEKEVVTGIRTGIDDVLVDRNNCFLLTLLSIVRPIVTNYCRS